MNGNTLLPLAQRTCAQCKSSKKKCDKVQPLCGRCSRLSIECSYPDLERQNDSDAGIDAADPRFEEVFRRLSRIEAQVFPFEANTQNSSEPANPLTTLAQSYGIEDPNPKNWSLEPGTLKPQYMTLILWNSVLSTLEEHEATVQSVTRRYIQTVDQWLPMISRRKYEKELALFSTFTSSENFLLLVLAQHLVITPTEDHPQTDDLSASPWYKTCKYNFSQFVAFGEPTIELIQMGMLISLFEYTHCIGEQQALITLGTCARLAYLLEFDEVMHKHSTQDLGKLSLEDEEILLTWMGLTRLDRYFNMPPLAIPKRHCMQLHTESNEADNIRPYAGPLIQNYTTLDMETIQSCIYEYDAAQRLGRVQKFIRENRYAPFPAVVNKVKPMLEDIDKYLEVRAAQMAQDGGWAGTHVVLSAAINLQCFFIAKQGDLDAAAMQQLYLYVSRLADVISRCRTFFGFTDNYLESIQPTWCSLPYQAVRAYRLLESADICRALPPIDMTNFLELFKILGPKYKLAAECARLLEME